MSRCNRAICHLLAKQLRGSSSASRLGVLSFFERLPPFFVTDNFVDDKVQRGGHNGEWVAEKFSVDDLGVRQVQIHGLVNQISAHAAKEFVTSNLRDIVRPQPELQCTLELPRQFLLPTLLTPQRNKWCPTKQGSSRG